MTYPVNRPDVSIPSFFSDLVVSTSIRAATGALAAVVLAMNPVAGALFAVTSAVGERCLSWIPNHASNKTAAYIVQFLGGIGLGVLATSLIGFPLTFTAGIGLAIAGIITYVVLDLIADISDCGLLVRSEDSAHFFTQFD